MEGRYANPRYGAAKAHIIAGWNDYVSINETVKKLKSLAKDRLHRDVSNMLESLYDDQCVTGTSWKHKLKYVYDNGDDLESFAKELLLMGFDYDVRKIRIQCSPSCIEQPAIDDKLVRSDTKEET